MDEYYSAPYFPKIKEKILVQTLPAQMGGMIANAACVYAGYGAPVSFLTALNPGAVSKELCRGLNEAGIDTEFMVWDESLPDAKTIIILAEGEHTVFIPTLNLQRIELSGEAMEALRQADYIYSTFCELRPLRFGEMTACQVLEDVKARGAGCGWIWMLRIFRTGTSRCSGMWIRCLSMRRGMKTWRNGPGETCAPGFTQRACGG